MNQSASHGMNKALTSFSLMTLFAFGCFTTAAFAQEKKANAQASKAEATATEPMELPGIFKTMPETSSSLTQKSQKSTLIKRNSEAQFAADTGKGVFGLANRRAEKRPAQVVAKNLARREARTVVVPQRTEGWESLNLGNLDRLNASDFHATAYCIKGRTATGEVARQGFVAADPKILPLGTLVHIEAGRYTGVYKVADTGGAIRGNKIDIYVPTYQEAKSFGRQKIKVKVLGHHK